MEKEVARDDERGGGEVEEARGRLVFFIERDKWKTRCA